MPTTAAGYKAIWPWEIPLEVAAGRTIVYGSLANIAAGTPVFPTITRPGPGN
jgi:hypothetical protein